MQCKCGEFVCVEWVEGICVGGGNADADAIEVVELVGLG